MGTHTYRHTHTYTNTQIHTYTHTHIQTYKHQTSNIKLQDEFSNQTKLPRGMRSRDHQALHGFAKFFEKSSGEEREHGMKLMEYQSQRGGRVVFQGIAKPSSMEWGTPLHAMEAALELEKTVNQSLLDLHKASDDKGDAHLCDYLEGEFLTEQVDGIKEIGDM